MAHYRMQHELSAPEALREELRENLDFRTDVTFSLHRGGFPDWLNKMPWSEATVACGDRLFRDPVADGFSLVIADENGPFGYISASLAEVDPENHSLCIEMIQVSAERRGEKIGETLAAGLAEIICREFDAYERAGRNAPQVLVEADTEGRAADEIVTRLTKALDQMLEASWDRVANGTVPVPGCA